MTAPRILLADDHTLFRQGLERVLREAFPKADFGHAEDTAETLRVVLQEPWDLLILDLSFGEGSGLDVLKEVKRVRPKLPVLVLSMHPEEQFAVRALKSGAAGYMTKRAAAPELNAAVRRVLSGGRWVTPSVAERLAVEIDSAHDKLPHERLSNREYHVFRQLASGRTVKSIASELSVSAQSVSTYRTRLLEKMGLETNAQLVEYALHHRLIG